MVDAARYLHVPHSTLQFWTSGHCPIVELAHGTRPPMLSFKNLVECYVVQGIRTIHRVKLPKVRKAASWMRANLTSRHPLADYDLICDGVDLFLELDEGKLLNLCLNGNAAFRPILEAHLQRVERNAVGMAER